MSLYKHLFTAYAHVRTEPQSDIGQTRGKKDGSSYDIQGALRVRSVVLFQASYHRGHTALMELHGELGRPLLVWGSAQAVSQQIHALQSIVFDAVG